MIRLAGRVRAGRLLSWPSLISCLALIFVLGLYFWHLKTLTLGLSPSEYLSRQYSQSFHQILDHGVNAPYYFLQHMSLKVFSSSPFALRATSVIVAFVIFACLLQLLLRWFGRLTAFFAGLILISTPWIILLGRNGAADIMLLWPIVILGVFLELTRMIGNKQLSQLKLDLFWLLFCSVSAIGIYTPGIIWLLIAAGFLARKRLMALTSRIRGSYLVAGLVIGLIILAPLIQSIFNHPSNLREIFLVPSKWPGILETLKAIGWGFSSLVWRSRNHVDITIDRLPILNILEATLVILGIYALSSKVRRITYFLVGLLVFSIILAGLNQNLKVVTLGLPAIAIFLAAGLRFVYREWRKVFPINPIARSLAIVLISLVVLAHLVYAIRYSLVAWPHTNNTRSTYVLK